MNVSFNIEHCVHYLSKNEPFASIRTSESTSSRIHVVSGASMNDTAVVAKQNTGFVTTVAFSNCINAREICRNGSVIYPIARLQPIASLWLAHSCMDGQTCPKPMSGHHYASEIVLQASAATLDRNPPCEWTYVY